MININVNPDPDPKLAGEREATPEEQEMLDRVMDTMEQAVHGEYRDNIIKAMNAHPDLWRSSSQIATGLVTRMAHKLDEEQVEYDSSVFFGQNGAIQQTVQMLWEMGDAMGHPAARDEDQMEAAYLATLQQIGDIMIEDEDSAKEAQAFLLQQELGEDVVDLAAKEMEAAAMEGQLMANNDDEGWIDKGLDFIGGLFNFDSDIGESRDPDDAEGRKAIRATEDTDIKLRKELDPNEALRRRMEKSGA